MTETVPPVVAGLVLAGGRATRIGGGDKPLLPVAGRPMLDHVLARLSPQVARVAISANGDPGRFAGYALPVVADTIDEPVGPLAGVLAGLDWARDAGATHLATTAGDTPFLPDDLVARLAKARAAAPDAIVVATTGGQRHPTFALWPVAAGEVLREWLETGGALRVNAFLDAYGVVEASFAAPAGIDPFFNVNTPEDLARAERLAARVALPVFGITGWKNSGKTTLTERLVAEFARRGLAVSTIKHAHHDFDIDKPGTDSFRHRAAGAGEVAIVSSGRWALMHELRDEAEPALETILGRLSPCDLVLIEGYKREAHPKIETRRRDGRDSSPLSADDPAIVAVAADAPQPGETLPVFDLDDVPAIADFIAAQCLGRAG